MKNNPPFTEGRRTIAGALGAALLIHLSAVAIAFHQSSHWQKMGN